MIHIVGLGSGNFDQITIETLHVMMADMPLYLRTAIHPAAEAMQQQNITFESFDAIYESAESFDAVYQTITDTLLEKAASGIDFIYAVPGNPLCGEATVTKLIEACKAKALDYRIYPATSFIDAVMTAVEADPIDGLMVIDAFMLNKQPPQPHCAALITQVYNQYMAGEVKLRLSEIYGDEVEVALVINAGMPDKQIVKRLPLYQIDQVPEINHLTSLFVPAQSDNYRDYARFVEIIRTLRAPGGCPWDREQTHQSLKPCLLEETYEVLDAIDEQDSDHLVEELGDVLMQVIMHSIIGEESGTFSINDVIEGISLKMIRRHPHVFAEKQLNTADEVLIAWDEIKKQEKNHHQHPMTSIPKSFTALMRADKIQSKAAKVGFDWNDPKDALEKVFEEAKEVKAALTADDPDNLNEELGDLLFAAVNAARLSGIKAELALQKANDKFIQRFMAMEKLAAVAGKNLQDYDLSGMDALWDAVKEREKQNESR